MQVDIKRTIIFSLTLTAAPAPPAASPLQEISGQICESVARSLEGQKLTSFTGVSTFVRQAFENSLSGILNKRQVGGPGVMLLAAAAAGAVALQHAGSMQCSIWW
jgi:hypothetical protein